MKRRRVLRVELNRYASVVAGPGAHELVRETTGRLPVWVSRLHGYSVSEATARDVAAAAELRGYDVEVTGHTVQRDLNAQKCNEDAATETAPIINARGRRSRREAAVAALRAAPAPRWPDRESEPGSGGLW